MWKSIRRGWEDFSKFVIFEVEDESKIRFRHDVRSGDHNLKTTFSVLFSIAHYKEASVGDYI